MTALDDPYGLLETATYVQPHPVYHALRHAEPVHWSPVLRSWLLTAYDDVRAALHDPRLSNARRAANAARVPAAALPELAAVDRCLSSWALHLDGEPHARVRRLLGRALRPADQRAQRARVRALATELLDALPAGEVDLVQALTRRLPVRVVAEAVGLPPDDVPAIAAWSADLARYFQLGADRPDVVAGAVAAVTGMGEHLAGFLRGPAPFAERVAEHGAGLPPEVVLANVLLLVFAGQETTVNLLGNALLVLLADPDQLARLRTHPELVGNAVQELLRYEGPILRWDRVAATDVEIRGRRIAAGDRVVLVLAAANRDPRRFRDPDRLDLTRPDAASHVSFGAGRHGCVGGTLAVVQAEEVVRLVAERFPAARLGGRPPRWREHPNFRSLQALPAVLR